MEVLFYQSFDQDFVKSRKQEKTLPENFKFEHTNLIYRFFATLLYICVLIWAFFYTVFYCRIKIHREKQATQAHETAPDASKSANAKCIYANHTSAFGDVLVPFYYCFPKRPHLICSASNLGIPVIGPLLPMAGAIPIPNSLKKTKEFNNVIKKRLEKGETLVIYPEAHLWPGCDFIRPLEKSAFYYPAEAHTSCYTATTVYTGTPGRVKTEIYLDGPYVSQKDKKHARAEDLQAQVKTSLEKRAKQSKNPEIKYISEDKKGQ
ncbi:MAG: 1-acyl-sn-glycerol-3-phosphate acyltransferase [Candidatus Saccharibacteria bacterium]|nr:1-acyl-sn-glycerol-3-phosphate acyltransferase [Candidatus Saccharibacteria bacterium]